MEQWRPGWEKPCWGEDLDWKDFFVTSSLLIPPVTTSVWHILFKAVNSHLDSRLAVWDVNKEWLQRLDVFFFFFPHPLFHHNPFPYFILWTHCFVLQPLHSCSALHHLKAAEEKPVVVFSARRQSLTWATSLVWTRYKSPYGRFN